MPQQYNEQTSGTYTATLVDEMGLAVNVAVLTEVTLTLYDLQSGEVINDRDYQDVKNANDVTINALGALEWKIQAADNAVVTDKMAGTVERHIAFFHFVWPGGELSHQVPINVLRLDAPEPPTP
jgi:hypothetical protein